MNDDERQRFLDQQAQMLEYIEKRLDEGVERWHEEQARQLEDHVIEGFQVEPKPLRPDGGL